MDGGAIAPLSHKKSDEQMVIKWSQLSIMKSIGVRQFRDQASHYIGSNEILAALGFWLKKKANNLEISNLAKDNETP